MILVTIFYAALILKLIDSASINEINRCSRPRTMPNLDLKRVCLKKKQNLFGNIK